MREHRPLPGNWKLWEHLYAAKTLAVSFTGCAEATSH